MGRKGGKGSQQGKGGKDLREEKGELNRKRWEKILGGKGRRSQGGKGLKISEGEKALGGQEGKDLNRERGQNMFGRKREKI